MQMSDNGIRLTQQYEGLSLKAYQDVVGIWTNGYGNTHGVVPGSTITIDQAIADLKSNLVSAENAVNKLVTAPLSQNQFDALVDFVFNLGTGNFSSSTLLRKLNAKDYTGASLEFPKWNKAGGKVVQGLTNRRLGEQRLFNMQ